jgi:hypothetical protein
VLGRRDLMDPERLFSENIRLGLTQLSLAELED